MKRSRTIFFSGLLFLVSAFPFSWAQPSEEFRSVMVDLFYETGCSDCQTVRDEVLPELKARFEGLYVLHEHDLDQDKNLRKLLRHQNALGVWANEPVSIVVDQRIMLCGVSNIRNQLLDCIEKCLAEKWSELPDENKSVFVGPADEEMLQTRFENFAFPAVIIAGLLDGINPCAISTLLFFISLLAVSKVRKRQLLLVGVSFCLASFLTYLALGFGLLRILHLFAGFNLIRTVLEWGMIIVLLVLAVLSFCDAFRFQKSREGHDVTLQLSKNMKERIHCVMHFGLKTKHLVFGGLFIGAKKGSRINR